MPYVDGPPWTVGQNCNVRFTYGGVNGGVATGFYLKPDSYRVMLPKVWYAGTNVKGIAGVSSPLVAGRLALELVVISEAARLHADGYPSQMTADQWHSGIMAYAAQVNASMTFDDPFGTAWTVGIEEMEDRWAPLGGLFAHRWETRLVLVEV